MDTKSFEPTFQMIANSVSSISLKNTIISIPDNEELDRDFSIRIKDISIEKHEDYKSAGLDMEISVSVAQKTTDMPKAIEIAVVINGIFIDKADVPDEVLEDKLKMNGTAALYSIGRGLIANISSQTLVNGKIILPLVNFMEASSKIDSQT